ncbi:MAG: response regulator transcription factor [Acidobacteria bacterium]|nr:response regulator transcription factor [Acidobacteriota bacterium]
MDERLVLLIEDEPYIRRALIDLLEDAGYATLTAETGHEAFDLLTGGDPRVAIVDINLPDGMSGYEVIRRLRDRFGDELAILVLSGIGAQWSDPVAQGIGADDYMTKPYNADELLERIRRLVGRSPGDDADPAVRQ